MAGGRARAGREMARTVHPALAGSVLWALRRHPGPSASPGPSAPGEPPGPGRAAAAAERLLAAGRPVPERLHRELLAALHHRGPAAVDAAARHLFDRPSDPLLRELLTAPGLPELVARARPAEGWLYIGHRTRTTLTGESLTIRHLPDLGTVPDLVETLYVCLVYRAGVELVTGRTCALVLLDEDGAVLPLEAGWRRPCPRLAGGRVEWAGPPLPAELAGRLPAAVRREVALDPARAWRLADMAAELGLAPRSLQRALGRAGRTFQGELTAVRLDVAARLIRRTGLPLAEIAAAAGFTDHPHLSRRFRARFGRTPQEFRAEP
ncbi:helix-turn-helix domain-containing protein [Kitasatospora indigofera]|uniref:helix-turn-helix transcriptional regulator n=1 Tax=Kitasatospora indigofera TaxID=67307 RepID=UPI003629429B